LNYVNKHCDDKFVLCHTINVRIRMKYSARTEQELNDESKDEGTGDWLYVSTTNDLLKHGIDVNFKLLDYQPLLINCE